MLLRFFFLDRKATDRLWGLVARARENRRRGAGCEKCSMYCWYRFALEI